MTPSGSSTIELAFVGVLLQPLTPEYAENLRKRLLEVALDFDLEVEKISFRRKEDEQ